MISSGPKTFVKPDDEMIAHMLHVKSGVNEHINNGQLNKHHKQNK